MRIDLIADRAGFDRLGSAWNALLGQDVVAPLGMDATGTFEWASAILESFLGNGDWFVLVASDDQGVAGILPLRTRASGALGTPQQVEFITELSGGRNGFLLRDADPTVLALMLDHLHDRVPDWITASFRLVRGSRSERTLRQALAQARLSASEEVIETSPIAAMPDDFDAYASSLKTSFRTELRRRERRLGEMGRLVFEIFESPAQIPRFWDAVIDIERQSWKEGAGSSITVRPEQERFYRALLPRAAAAGLWLSALLLLDDRPIAHRFSVRFAGVAVGLKTSYVQEMRKFAPAELLQWMYLREIHRRGLRHFDFSGNCEDHKMQWTSDTYVQVAHVIYRRGTRGGVARLRHQLGASIRRLSTRV